MRRLRLTPIGKLFGALMALFYVASVTSQSALLLLFIGLMGGCLVVNAYFARRSVNTLQVGVPVSIELVEGEASHEPWSVENITTKTAEMVDVCHGKVLLFRVALLEGKNQILLKPNLIYAQRGVYPYDTITLSSAAPYGLVRSTCQLVTKGEIIVLPRVYETEAPDVSGLELMSGGRHRGGRQVSYGTHFAGVRSWQAGDSMRQVHWKSTARKNQLMVKTFEEELGGRLTIILECEASAEAAVTNNAVRAAASIAPAALQEGNHVDLLGPGTERLRLAPFSDERELLQRLARYRAGGEPCDVGELGRRSTVAIFGTRWNERIRALIDAAASRNQRVLLYLPDGEEIQADVELLQFSENAIYAPGRARP